MIKEDISGIMGILTNLGIYIIEYDSFVKDIEEISVSENIQILIEQLTVEDMY